MKLCVALLAGALAAIGQTPDCRLFAGWQQTGNARHYEGQDLFEYMDGNSEGYFLYGFVRMDGVTCSRGADSVLLDISEFADPESAYGMFLANRDVKQAIDPIGTGGQLVPRKVFFAKDKYYVEITAPTETDHTSILRAMAAAVDTQIRGSTAKPEPLTWFPPENLTGGTARLAPESVLGIRALKRGYVGFYGEAKAFVVTEPSADAAKATLGKLRDRFQAARAAPVGEEAFQAKDQYLGNICMFRKGARIAGYANVPDGKDPLVLAQALSRRLP
jgi:hypothetical protein